jgi:hypothetical protein
MIRYDDCLNTQEVVIGTSSLDKFFDEPVVLPKNIDTTRKSDVYKTIYVHFRNVQDMADFCEKISQVIDYKTSEIYYPVVDKNTNLFDDLDNVESKSIKVEQSILVPRKTKSSVVNKKAHSIGANKWKLHWNEMPDFVQEERASFRSVTIKFRTESDYKMFSDAIEQTLSSNTKSIWHPKLDNPKNSLFRWVQDVPSKCKYPVYIISKNRSDSMYTSRSLNDMGVQHYIAVEPQDVLSYTQALDDFKISTATILTLPFSNHGMGSGPARNFCWDHSIENGHKRHWILDDNIQDFYRLHQNTRYRVKSPVFFRVMEDFVDRYKNIRLAGPRYRFFCSSDQKYPAFIKNTHIMSCILIDNSIDFRWRSKYNEDIDLSLRVLKEGGCTVLFNAFLQGKCATQTVKGGNTEEVYKADQLDYTDTTYEKTIVLANLHPDVVRVVERYGRWHHHVDYSKFEHMDILLDDNVVLSNAINDYRMRLEKLDENERVD